MEKIVNEPGLAVEIGRIDKELGKLWESSGDTKTRASLINLVIYSEDQDSLEANTALISTIASQHAFRAILILANPAASTPGAHAWISAHCHLAGKGGRQICSEQITFRLDGESASALPNIVFSHLDSDLPLCFWSQAEFREPLDEQLWAWVDRLIYDSSTWRRPDQQLAITAKISSLTHGRTVLCDLSWTRLYRWRFALANVFDHSSALSRLDQISAVLVECAPGERTTALLIIGWLAVQLDWQLMDLLSNRFFQSRRGSQIGFEVRESAPACLSRVELSGAGFRIELRRDEDSGFFHATLECDGMPPCSMTLGASQEKLGDTLLAELSRGGRHPIYARVLDSIRPLLAD